MNRKRTTFITLFLLILLAGACGIWLRIHQQQYVLNRQLIAALVKNDDRQALKLVNEGADPNTQYKPTPVPSLRQLWDQLLHRLPPPTNDSPTAFLIVCGAYSKDEDAIESQNHRSENVPLVQVMLEHGAKVNAKDRDGWTSLMYAGFVQRWNIVGVLLEHGVDANAKNKDGDTPLMFAAAYGAPPNVVRLLLEHGANVNTKDNSGYTPLTVGIKNSNASPEVIRLLLKHGADVNAEDDDGTTPLMYAQGHPNIITLLKHAGARK